MHTALSTVAALTCSLLFLSSPLAAQDDVLETVSAIEQSLWQGWKDRDGTAFREHIAENHLQIGSAGITSGKETVIRGMEDASCAVESFSLSNWQVHRIAEDALILTYDANQDAVCDGRQNDPEVVASAVYVRVGGRWLAASYQDSPRGGM